MIAMLTGRVQQVAGDFSIINVGGVGFQVYMPLNSLEELTRCDEEVIIYTYLSHKEDAMTLYGFLRPEDKSLFQLIISVSGIGPKTALNILSFLPADDFRRAILNEETKALTKAPGVGLKSAQRLILELKSKIAKTVTTEERAELTAITGGTEGRQLVEDATAALIALGYPMAEATEVVKKVWQGNPNQKVPDLVRNSLKHLMR
ncbi:MAG TPA: Holliday junction branch migration protein RuvA [Firmicutes bacterium]|nr:Holliday junction branch migration protein RuvA [Bacillota bacterium]